MEYCIWSLWVRVDYALSGGGSLCMLESTIWKFSEYSIVEDDFAMLNVMYLERKKNDQSFEDCERMMVKLKAFFFKTLYQYMCVYMYLLLICKLLLQKHYEKVQLKRKRKYLMIKNPL